MKNQLTSAHEPTFRVKTVKADNPEHLKNIIEDTIKKNGNNCDLNFIDVSSVTDLSGLFKDSKFNGDISKWNVANVTDMSGMFKYSQFNGDISNRCLNIQNISVTFDTSQLLISPLNEEPPNI